jgi:RimJ/RimL family protein N-acetyltransferase
VDDKPTAVTGLWAKPTLTGRLVELRPFTEADYEPAFEMLNDPVGADLTDTDETFTMEQAVNWYSTRNQQDGRIDLAIIERATGEFAGEVVLNEYEPARNTCSFRISLRGPGWFGRGLGTEATELIVAHGFDHVGLDRIELEVLARNPRARRAYEKSGFEVTAEVHEDGEDWVHMAITRRPSIVSE